MMKHSVFPFLLFILSAVSGFPQGPGIIRGPYLNIITSTSATIRWRTEEPTKSVVAYGISVTNLKEKARDEKAVIEHEVTIKGLKPADKYFYTVGSKKGKTKGFVEQYFKTAPVIGSVKPIRIWALGDFGNGSRTQEDCRDAVLRATTDHRPDLWIWLGDNAYEAGLDDEYQRHVFRVYQESFFKNTSLYPAPGNHDYGDAEGDGSAISYYKIFSMPQQGESGGIPSGSKAYYSVDYGNAHIVSLDSQGKLDGGFRIYDTLSRQVQWLKKDLAANRLPWTIVYFHHPPYTKGSHNSDTEDELIKIRENLVPVLEHYKVDLVLCGHSHVYERTHPMKGHYGFANSFDPAKHVVGKVDSQGVYRVTDKDQGIIYVVNGAGAWVGGKDWEVSKDNGYPMKSAVYSNNSDGGSMILDVNDNRLDARWICADGVVRDQFTIIKPK
jgi:hypothetical protein